MTIIFVTVGIFAVVMLVMAIGVIVRGKCLSGSCGGPKVTGPNGELVCGSCGRHSSAGQAGQAGDSEPEAPRVHSIDFR